jgi:hypothetical protein
MNLYSGWMEADENDQFNDALFLGGLDDEEVDHYELERIAQIEYEEWLDTIDGDLPFFEVRGGCCHEG